MSRNRFLTLAFALTLSIGAFLLLGGAATAQTKVEGLIVGRNGATMTLQTSDSPKLLVVLTDDTQVAQVQGMFKARRRQMSMAALVPGLLVKAQGTPHGQTQLGASSVTFHGMARDTADTTQSARQPANAQ